MLILVGAHPKEQVAILLEGVVTIQVTRGPSLQADSIHVATCLPVCGKLPVSDGVVMGRANRGNMIRLAGETRVLAL